MFDDLNAGSYPHSGNAPRNFRRNNRHSSSRLPKSPWSFGGDLVGDWNVEASGMAAFGVGFDETKVLYGDGADSVNFDVVALGLSASADTDILNVSYTGGTENPLGLTMGFGLSADYHEFLGGGFTLQYIPPSTFTFSLHGGVGAGGGFHVYSIGKQFPGG